MELQGEKGYRGKGRKASNQILSVAREKETHPGPLIVTRVPVIWVSLSLFRVCIHDEVSNLKQ